MGPSAASQPAASSTEPDRKPNWFVRHKVLSVLSVLLQLGFCAPEFGGSNKSETSAADSDRNDSSLGDEPGAEGESADEGQADSNPKQRTRRYEVIRVIDGDTVEVAYNSGATVRVIGIDTSDGQPKRSQ